MSLSQEPVESLDFHFSLYSKSQRIDPEEVEVEEQTVTDSTTTSVASLSWPMEGMMMMMMMINVFDDGKTQMTGSEIQMEKQIHWRT